MATIEELNERFAIPNVARFDSGRGGLTRLALKTPLSEGHVYLHGAHVTHFQPAGHKPVLFLSDKSEFADGKAIRGGVPVIFPWFGPRDGDKTQMHGLVRTRGWEVREVAAQGVGARVTLALVSDDRTRAIWDHDFEISLAVTFDAALRMELTVTNTSDRPWKFAEALHSYFGVGDIERTAVEGLAGTTYVEKFLGPEHRVQPSQPPLLELAGPTDRVYLDTAAACVIHDRASGRRIRNIKENSHTTVVWNPWSDAIGNFADLSASDWKRFLCVETCNVWDFARMLEPGGQWRMRARVEVEGE